MSVIHTTSEFLNKPYPDDYGPFTYYRTLIIISLFVAFFLFIFQPFGISDLESHKLLICIGFGSMTFLGSLVYEWTVVPLQRSLGLRTKWTFWKWTLNNMGIMFFISLANFLFVRLVLFGFIQWDLFPTMVYGTFMIGLIPFSVLGAIDLMNQEKKYRGIAKEFNQQKARSSSANENQKTIYNLPVDQIRYVEALQNYVKIGYINPDGRLAEQTERSTLKGIMEQIKGSSMIKCHRSFLVNRNSIISSTGNAQGLLLTLEDCEKVIPVSRSFVSHLK